MRYDNKISVRRSLLALKQKERNIVVTETFPIFKNSTKYVKTFFFLILNWGPNPSWAERFCVRGHFAIFDTVNNNNMICSFLYYLIYTLYSGNAIYKYECLCSSALLWLFSV